MFDEKTKRSLIIELKKDPYNYCSICIINESVDDEVLCEKCYNNEYNDKEICKDILLECFDVGGIELYETFSKKIFVENINEILLSNYLRGEYYGKKCKCHSPSQHVFDDDLNCVDLLKHYVNEKFDFYVKKSGGCNGCKFPNCECNVIQKIIDLGVDLSYIDGYGTFINKANSYDISILVKNGADINQIYDGNKTAMSNLCYKIITGEESKDKFDFLLKCGADLNLNNYLWRNISGIQYKNRPHRIEFIKHLIKAGINCENVYVTDNKKLYDTRVGLIVIKELYEKLFEQDGSSVMIDNPDAYRILLNNMNE